MSAILHAGCGDDPAITARAYTGEPAFTHIKFGNMVGLVYIPDGSGDVMVVLKGGELYRARTDYPEEPALFLNIRPRMIERSALEEGLLGLAFAPDYATSGYFYLQYTAGAPRRNVISRFTAERGVADASSEEVILEVQQPHPEHNGGALVFGPDGYLYIALGDGGGKGDPFRVAQKTDRLLGKILRIDVSDLPYTIPPDNPFVAGGGRPEIFAYGLRNPWRLSFDRTTGDLWTGDVGELKFEEVDKITNGGNYGWSVVEGDNCFREQECDRDGFEEPHAVYPRAEGCAIVGGYVYRGTALPEMEGWYLYGDYCTGNVWAVDTMGDDGPTLLFKLEGQLITSWVQDPAGELYVVTFDGAIFKLALAASDQGSTDSQ